MGLKPRFEAENSCCFECRHSTSTKYIKYCENLIARMLRLSLESSCLTSKNFPFCGFIKNIRLHSTILN